MRVEAAGTLAPALIAANPWLDDARDEFLRPQHLVLAAERAVPAGWAPLFLNVSDADGLALSLPLMARGGRYAALTTPYACLWAPLARPGAGDAAASAAARWLQRFAVGRWDALDATDPAVALLCRGFAAAGSVARPFAHFAAWSGPVGDADAYFAARPGALRTVLRRKGKRAQAAGWTCAVHAGEAAIGVYEAVAARSWKPPEPYPGFLRAWMQAACRDGTGRIGVLSSPDAPLAAQFWTLWRGRARVHKLVQDAAADAGSPGTLLTAAMIRVELADGARTLDFGRGDDGYKAGWVSERVMREGLLIARPWRVSGAAALLRHAAGRARASVRQGSAHQDDP